MKNTYDTYTAKIQNIEELRKSTAFATGQYLKYYGCVPPLFVWFGRRGCGQLNAPQFTDDAVKDKFVEECRLLCIAEEASVAIFATEAWKSNLGCADEAFDASRDENRQEVVMVRIELPGNVSEIHFHSLKRNSGAKPRLGQCQILPGHLMSGRFSQFLPQNPPTEIDRLIAGAHMQNHPRVKRVNFLFQTN